MLVARVLLPKKLCDMVAWKLPWIATLAHLPYSILVAYSTVIKSGTSFLTPRDYPHTYPKKMTTRGQMNRQPAQLCVVRYLHISSTRMLMLLLHLSTSIVIKSLNSRTTSSVPRHVPPRLGVQITTSVSLVTTVEFFSTTMMLINLHSNVTRNRNSRTLTFVARPALRKLPNAITP